MSAFTRDAIFISHANPEDNEIYGLAWSATDRGQVRSQGRRAQIARRPGLAMSV